MHSYIFVVSQSVKAETVSNWELFDKVDHWSVDFGVDYTDSIKEAQKKDAIESLKSYFDVQIPSDDCDRYAISVSSKKQAEMLHNIRQKLQRNLSKFEEEINLPSGVNHAQFYLQNIVRTASGMDDDYIFYNLDDDELYTMQSFAIFEIIDNAKYYVADVFDYHF